MLVKWSPYSASFVFKIKLVGLEQDCSISSASAMDIVQSCTKPSICPCFVCALDVPWVTRRRRHTKRQPKLGNIRACLKSPRMRFLTDNSWSFKNRCLWFKMTGFSLDGFWSQNAIYCTNQRYARRSLWCVLVCLMSIRMCGPVTYGISFNNTYYTLNWKRAKLYPISSTICKHFNTREHISNVLVVKLCRMC